MTTRDRVRRLHGGRTRHVAGILAGFLERAIPLAGFVLLAVGPARAQLGMGTAFAYQGSLTEGGAPANGSFDFQFLLHDDESGGTQIGSSVFSPATPVAKGVFTATLDFGAGAFDGGERWLEIRVQPAGGGGYAPLTPRVAIRPTAHALFSADTGALDGSDASDFLQRLGESHAIPRIGPDAATNGANLLAAYALARTRTPHGLPLSADNRFTVLVPPGNYDLGAETLLLDTECVDVVGMSESVHQVILGTGVADTTGVVTQTADDVAIENLEIRNTNATGASPASFLAYRPETNLPATVIRNCRFLANDTNAFSMRLSIEYSGIYERCEAGIQAFGGSGGVASGRFVDCVAGDTSFGSEGIASGTFVDCVGGEVSFGGALLDFLPPGIASGRFERCEAGDYSFGAVGTASGTFRDCKAANRSFGGDDGTASGTFFDCTAGDESFGGNDGLASGEFLGCESGQRSFGSRTSGSAAGGRFLFCKGGIDAYSEAGTPAPRHMFCLRSNQRYIGND